MCSAHLMRTPARAVSAQVRDTLPDTARDVCDEDATDTIQIDNFRR